VRDIPLALAYLKDEPAFRPPAEDFEGPVKEVVGGDNPEVAVQDEVTRPLILASPGDWEALRRALAGYAGHNMVAAYEAGYFGFRLHRPPGESWQPLSGCSSESGPPGNRPVKTGKQMLKRVLVLQRGATRPSSPLRLEVIRQTTQNHELVQL